jgi:hypothetical protein
VVLAQGQERPCIRIVIENREKRRRAIARRRLPHTSQFNTVNNEPP